MLGVTLVVSLVLQSTSSGFSLVELRALEIPMELQVSGASVSADSTVLFWSTSQHRVVRWDGRSIEILCPDKVQMPLAARVKASSEVEIIDGDGPVVHQTSPDRSFCSTSKLQGLPLGVLPTSGRWIGKSPVMSYENQSPGNLSTLFVGFLDGGAVTVIPLDSVLPAEDTLPSRHLRSSSGDRAIVSNLVAPFSWVVINLEGAVLLARTDEDLFEDLGIRPDEAADWSSLGVVRLDRGYLQTLADMRSDRRLLVRYDELGSLVGTNVVGVAVGVMASNPEARLIIALRRSDILEVVLYAWHWSA